MANSYRRDATLHRLATLLLVLACCMEAKLTRPRCFGVDINLCQRLCNTTNPMPGVQEMCEGCNPGFKCIKKDVSLPRNPTRGFLGAAAEARKGTYDWLPQGYKPVQGRQSVGQTTPHPGITDFVDPNTDTTTVDFVTADDITTDPTDPDTVGPTDPSAAGCFHLGQDRPEGSVWPDDPNKPCTYYTCTDGAAIQINTTQCEPAPSPDCEPWETPGRCCPKWDCEVPQDSACTYLGVVYEDGATWPQDALRPCVYFGCRQGHVYIAHTEPPCPASPGPHCLSREVPYQCCPAYDCVNITCTYRNLTFVEGAIWPDNPLHPCKWFTCQRTGVVLFNSTDCMPLTADDCGGQAPVVPPGECCKQCSGSSGDDSMCMDSAGVIHDEGCIYFNDPLQCQLVECVNNTEVVVLDLSDNCPPPPHPACFAEDTLVGCCPVYNCSLSPCIDYLGNPRSEGEVYYNDANKCILVHCINNNEEELVDLSDTCTQPPPEANCTVVPSNDQCCPQYNCPNFCEYNGQFYPVGVQWWDDNQRRCNLFECVEFGIIQQISTELPCRKAPRGCTGQTVIPNCCPHKYTCMFDFEHNLIPMI